ncbi:hypothetical protein ACFL9S_04030 [Erwinia sp. AnSW2-5]
MKQHHQGILLVATPIARADYHAAFTRQTAECDSLSGQLTSQEIAS